MLSTDEQKELNRLRDKHKDGHGLPDTLGLQDAGAAKQAVCAADDCLAHVHLCNICQGSGVHTELYGFRRLESTCKHCSGEGVLTTGSKASSNSSTEGSQCGKQHTANTTDGSDGSSVASAAAAAAAASSQPVTRHIGVAAGSAAASRRKTERELAGLTQKMASIKQEKASLIASLAAGPSSSMKQALQENLVEQLQRHLDDLVAAHAARQAVLRTA